MIAELRLWLACKLAPKAGNCSPATYRVLLRDREHALDIVREHLHTHYGNEHRAIDRVYRSLLGRPLP